MDPALTRPAASSGSPDSPLDRALSQGLASVYQPIVDLATGSVVAYEALVRGPAGSPLERPDALFAAARAAGRVAEVDVAARTAGLTGAVTAGLTDPLTLFLNVEPVSIDEQLADDAAVLLASTRLPLVFEFTERALTARPAELLAAAARVRRAGWRVALDDVGADSASLALMPFLRPEVVKLDLRLVQARPDGDVAEIVTAVNAYAQRSGAVVLAEGIETEQHLQIAKALGATLGQGWLFGRPGALGSCGLPAGGPLPAVAPAPPADPRGSVWELAQGWHPPRRSTKPLLVALSKHLEAQARATGETAVLIGAFQHARHFTGQTALRYSDVAQLTTLTVALGEEMPALPTQGVRGAPLAADDPLCEEWDVVVLSPHFAAALIAKDLGDRGPESERRFDVVVSYDRDLVADAAAVLISRVPPEDGTPVRPARVAARSATAVPEALTATALAAATNGITIADATRPEFPIVFANDAFVRLAGRPVEEVLGGSCRFMQGPDTDPATVRELSKALAAGRSTTVTLLNYRGEERTPWWNEVTVSPVRDAAGTVVQVIGVQQDVTSRVLAERALRQERDRAAGLLQTIEHLADHDPLTGALNRRALDRELESALADATGSGRAVAVLYLDLDGFKGVNDVHGHEVGDALLTSATARVRAALRDGDLLARPGGDEFVVVLPGLPAASAADTAQQVAGRLVAELGQAHVQGDLVLHAPASIGVALGPQGCPTPADLLRVADAAMYRAKRGGTGWAAGERV